jgi:hypothetical protein
MRSFHLLFVVIFLALSACANNPPLPKEPLFSKLQIGMSATQVTYLLREKGVIMANDYRLKIKPDIKIDPKASLSDDAGTAEQLYEHEGILIFSVDRGANQVLSKIIVDSSAGKFWPIQQTSPQK